MQNFEKCPFQIGDTVAYHPSEHGLGYEVMRCETLVPGREYVVKEVLDDKYVVVDQDGHPRGMAWTEFQPKQKEE